MYSSNMSPFRFCRDGVCLVLFLHVKTNGMKHKIVFHNNMVRFYSQFYAWACEMMLDWLRQNPGDPFRNTLYAPLETFPCSSALFCFVSGKLSGRFLCEGCLQVQCSVRDRCGIISRQIRHRSNHADWCTVHVQRSKIRHRHLHLPGRLDSCLRHWFKRPGQHTVTVHAA